MDLGGFWKLYNRIILDNDFVPKMMMVVRLMKVRADRSGAMKLFVREAMLTSLACAFNFFVNGSLLLRESYSRPAGGLCRW